MPSIAPDLTPELTAQIEALRAEVAEAAARSRARAAARSARPRRYSPTERELRSALFLESRRHGGRRRGAR